MFVATRQSGGLGRLGRRWESPTGGLWMTLAWPLPLGGWEEIVDGLGLRVGVACVEGLGRGMAWAAGGDRLSLKWPNDVMLDGRKVAGALVEVVVGAEGRRWALVGVGVNANFGAGELPEALRGRATTLIEAGGPGARVDLDDLRDDLLRALAVAVTTRGLPESVLSTARAFLAGEGERVTMTLPDGSRIEGVLRGIDDEGRALLELRDGRTIAISSGEVGA